jgi:hypothetical protein
MWNLVILFLLSVGLLWAFHISRQESFLDGIPYADPNIVQTSGMDMLNPLPFYVKYGYPDLGLSLYSPNWFYDTAFTGPIQKPWTNKIYRTY